MSSYEETVRFNLEQIEDGELIAKIHSGELTEQACAVARKILLSRGVEITPATVTRQESKHVPLRDRVLKVLTGCYRGEENLSVAFWTVGGYMLALLLPMLPFALLLPNWGGAMFLMLGSVASIFHTVCVWRCAKNAESYAVGQTAKLYTAFQSVVPLILIFSALWAIIEFAIR